MRNPFGDGRSAAINHRIRPDADVSRRPYRRRPATVLELAIEAIDEERCTEVVGMVFWSIAIAAEPIHVRTIRSMLSDARLRADHFNGALDTLLSHGFVRLAGAPNTYCVKESWWPYLRAFGGHYDKHHQGD